MQTAAGSACIGSQRLRGLLESDRLAADEVRPRSAQTPLATTDYAVPLRLRMKRRLREDARVRIGSLLASVGLVLVVLVGAIDLTSARAGQAGATIPAPTSHEPRHLRGTALVISHQPLAAPALHVPPREHAVGDRLQRARRALRRSDAEGAARARVLLEDLLRAKPKHGRAYAALAEACLRLEDAGCARTAVTRAVARQPRRVKYRALAARIDDAFSHDGE
jgi:cytochrome c-type biogenesis protein CcmH/NrfG